MLLVIDVGNTETVIGLYAPDVDDGAPAPEESIGVGIGTEHDPTAPRGLTHHWRLSTSPSRTPDEHAVLLTQLLDLEGLDISTVGFGHRRLLVSTARDDGAAPNGLALVRGIARVVLGPGTKSGMPILYDNPKEVGADRIADAVGAYDLYGGPCVVVDMGTATTVEAISANGEYMGGAITPGVGVSLDALYQSAAALRRVELVEPRSVIGRSTVESIESGTLYGFAGLVDSLARRFMEELGPATVVATGGFSSLIAPYSDTIEHVEPWLTLHGLRIVYERNVPS